MNILDKVKRVDPALVLKAVGGVLAVAGFAINKKIEANDKAEMLNKLGQQVKEEVIKDLSEKN